MNKLILAIGLTMTCLPALAQNYTGQYDFMSNNPVAQENERTLAREEAQRPAYNYQPCYSPDVSNPVITRSEYPGAMDPVRNLPAWSYNP